MDDFPDRYHLPKLNQDQVNNLNHTITPKEIEAAIKSLKKKKKKPRAERFSTESNQTFKEE